MKTLSIKKIEFKFFVRLVLMGLCLLQGNYLLAGVGPADTSAILVSKEGNVGIGSVNNPINKLEVGGNLHMDGNFIYFHRGVSDRSAFMRWSDLTDRINLFSFKGINLGQTDENSNLVPILSVGLRNNTAGGGVHWTPAVDIASMKRSATDFNPEIPLALYVSGDLNDRSKNIQFRQNDGKQGIGFTANTIYTAGTDDQDLNLEAKKSLVFKTNGSDRMVIDNNGKVNIGIGVNNQNKLELGGNLHMDGNIIFFRNRLTDTADYIKWTGEAADRLKLSGWHGIELSVTESGRIGLSVNSRGFVGIGTNAPDVPLHVRLIEGRSNDDYQAGIDNNYSHYMGWNGVISQTYSSGGSRKFGSCSILADGDIVTKNILVSTATPHFSDIRLKKNIAASTSQQDLEKLRQIAIVNYKMIDTIADNKQYKKVIAQQVQRVYPIAVDTSFRTLPDVFQPAVSAIKQNDSTYLITLAKPQHLKAGDKVELKLQNDVDVIADVISAANPLSLTVKSATAIDVQKGIFVYGRQANDVLTVDYDAISMLNVSATQQLAKVIDQQQQEIALLKKQVADMAQAMKTVTAQAANMQDSKTRAEDKAAASAQK